MKLWRKLAKKDPVTGTRNGRSIAYKMRMSEQYAKLQPRTTDLLDALFHRAGLKFIMTKKEEAKLAEMVASIKEENTDETK